MNCNCRRLEFGGDPEHADPGIFTIAGRGNCNSFAISAALAEVCLLPMLLIVRICLSVSFSQVYYWCVNSINCTGKNMSDDLLFALGEADANMYLCSRELRPSKHKFHLF